MIAIIILAIIVPLVAIIPSMILSGEESRREEKNHLNDDWTR